MTTPRGIRAAVLASVHLTIEFAAIGPRQPEGRPFGLAGTAANASTPPIRACPRQPASGVPSLSRGAQPGGAGKPPAMPSTATGRDDANAIDVPY
jgi:hypothetical protein